MPSATPTCSIAAPCWRAWKPSPLPRPYSQVVTARAEKLPRCARLCAPMPACERLCQPIAAPAGLCQLLPFAAKYVLSQVTAGPCVRAFCILTFTIFRQSDVVKASKKQLPTCLTGAIGLLASRVAEIAFEPIPKSRDLQANSATRRRAAGRAKMALQLMGRMPMPRCLDAQSAHSTTSLPFLVVTLFAQRKVVTWPLRVGPSTGLAGGRFLSDFRATSEVCLPIWARGKVRQLPARRLTHAE